MRSLVLLCGILFINSSALSFMFAAELKLIHPPGVKPVGPYTPGILAGDYLYISGQGARDASAKLPASPEEQIRQCLRNVEDVIKTAGLTMDHVVYAQAYLGDTKHYPAMNKIFAEFFPKNAPARSTVGVARMPTDTPFEIAAVAVRDLRLRKPVKLPAIQAPVPFPIGTLAGDRFYLSGTLGQGWDGKKIPPGTRAQVQLMVERVRKVLSVAGLEIRHLVYANVYVKPNIVREEVTKLLDEILPTETAISIVPVNDLPFDADIEISGVAAKPLQRFGACSALAETIYCKGRWGSPNAILNQLKADLAAAQASLGNVVASNVYVDNIDEFAAMNKIYATFFETAPPTRTTVQPVAVGGLKGQSQISVIAVR